MSIFGKAKGPSIPATSSNAVFIEAERLRNENCALRTFVGLLGFDSDKIAAAFGTDSDNYMCKSLSVSALTIGRDFSKTSFSQSGIDAANLFLNDLLKEKADTAHV